MFSVSLMIIDSKFRKHFFKILQKFWKYGVPKVHSSAEYEEEEGTGP